MNLLRVSVRVACPLLARVAGFYVVASNAMLGRAIKQLLRGQFEEDLDETDASVGDRALSALYRVGVRKPEDAEDVIQDTLRYLIDSKYRLRAKSAKDGLNELIGYFKTRGISHSTSKSKKEKRAPKAEDLPAEEVEEAELTDLRLDDKSDIAAFMEEFGDLLPDFVSKLSQPEKAIFDIIFNDGVGTFAADIKQNMSQSTAIREKYPELYEKNQKRWSAFVGEVRKKLFEKLQDFLFNDTSKQFREKMRAVSADVGLPAPLPGTS